MRASSSEAARGRLGPCWPVGARPQQTRAWGGGSGPPRAPQAASAGPRTPNSTQPDARAPFREMGRADQQGGHAGFMHWRVCFRS